MAARAVRSWAVVGGGVRPIVARTGGAALRAGAAAPNAGDVFDAMKSPEGPNTLPTFGQVANNEGMKVEKAVGSVPPLSWPVNAARGGAEAGIADLVAQGAAVVGDRAPSLTPPPPTRRAPASSRRRVSRMRRWRIRFLINSSSSKRILVRTRRSTFHRWLTRSAAWRTQRRPRSRER